MHPIGFNRQKRSLSFRFGLCAAVSGLFSILCFGAFALTGSSVDAQGFLHEPFFLVPTGYFFIGLCLLLSVPALICALASSARER